MFNEDQKKPEIPHRMSRIAFPKAKYGVYIATIIIIAMYTPYFAFGKAILLIRCGISGFF